MGKNRLSAAEIRTFRVWRKARIRRILFRMYRDAVDDTVGKRHDDSASNPEHLTPEPQRLTPDEQMSLAVDHLVRLDGEAQAAQMLGLTPEQVAAQRQRVRDTHPRTWNSRRPSDPKIRVFPAWRKKLARRAILRMYHDAVDRAAGKGHDDWAANPQHLTPEEQMSLAVDHLVRLDGEAQAAQMLGLTPEQVATQRQRARDTHLRIWRSIRFKY